MFKQKQLSEGFFKKDVMRKFFKIYKKTSVPESLFLLWCLLVNFAKLVTSLIFAEQHWTAASEYNSIVSSSKGSTVLVNETVNYDTKTKAYVIICARCVSY